MFETLKNVQDMFLVLDVFLVLDFMGLMDVVRVWKATQVRF